MIARHITDEEFAGAGAGGKALKELSEKFHLAFVTNTEPLHYPVHDEKDPGIRTIRVMPATLLFENKNFGKIGALALNSPYDTSSVPKMLNALFDKLADEKFSLEIAEPGKDAIQVKRRDQTFEQCL